MSCLDDANITRLVGVCFADDPICIVLEYHKYGDLKRFLRRHVVDVGGADGGTVATSNAGTDILRYNSLFSPFNLVRLTRQS